MEMNNSKIVTLDELLPEVSGKKVVFTNGCFDIIHIAHIKLLEFAKMQGDLLVVGINSDTSVKRLKGDKRPIVPEQERAQILASLVCTDYIVIFSEDTPVETIRALRPHVHVKGGDYDMDEIPEASLLKSYGARILRFDYMEGYSSTNIISRILLAYQ